MSADVHAWAGQLRKYATHFAPRDWCYTRDCGELAEIRYNHAEDTLCGRIRSAFQWLVRKPQDWERVLGVGRFAMAAHVLKRDKHLPDGVLDGGNVITFWEETGEYLQFVQPSVGALLADLMDAHPGLPEVVAIAEEMKRINDDYALRVGGAS